MKNELRTYFHIFSVYRSKYSIYFKDTLILLSGVDNNKLISSNIICYFDAVIEIRYNNMNYGFLCYISKYDGFP